MSIIYYNIYITVTSIQYVITDKCLLNRIGEKRVQRNKKIIIIFRIYFQIILWHILTTYYYYLVSTQLL